MKPSSKKPDNLTKRLSRNPTGQDEMFDKSYEEEIETVECLGRTFENDEARREYFLQELGRNSGMIQNSENSTVFPLARMRTSYVCPTRLITRHARIRS